MILDELRQHIERVKQLHRDDLDEGFGAKKYRKAAWETSWQYVFLQKLAPLIHGPRRRKGIMCSNQPCTI
jgi:cell shape-determining protein MreC